MNKEARILKIEEIKKSKPVGSEQLVWKDVLGPKDVFQIPLECLLYNKYNGRILSRTKSLEAQGVSINPETPDGKKTIETLLWESKVDRNERTKSDLKKYGQKRVGIITRDGVIIDGNRRAMLLNQIEKYDYFRAIILDVNSDQDPVEIEKLETSYQMGEDEKLSYNPIELYLKTLDQYKLLSQQSSYNSNKEDTKAVKKIYEWIGDYKSDKGIKGVKFRLQVMSLMNEYLDNFGYNDVYTLLDGREEQFRGLTRWLQHFFNSSAKRFDGSTDIDIDDLKSVGFDLIRAKCANTDFRYLAGGKDRTKHIFGYKDIWKSFLAEHDELISSFEEPAINFDAPKFIKSLESRDADYIKNVGNELIKNLTSHYGKVRNKLEKDKALVLSKKGFDAIDAINPRSPEFSKPEVLDTLGKLRDRITEMIQVGSPGKTLQHILSLLSTLDLKAGADDKDDLLDYLKQIGKDAYQLEKRVKKEL